MTIEISQFKQAMSQFASGVTIVTTMFQGKPIGITVSSFSSLSIEPPLVLVSLSKQLFTHKAITDSGNFAVNILAHNQLERGMIFAGMRPEIEDRFAGMVTDTAVTGCPIFPDALAWVDCTVWEMYNGGDHTIFVGEVQDVFTAGKGEPLLYHDRKWLTLK